MNRDELILRLKDIKTAAEECLRFVAADATKVSTVMHIARPSAKREDIEFSKPVRPFMKSYSKNLAGSKKFVLLLAWLAKGQPKKQIALSEIRKRWGQMTGILGMDFNLFFSCDAKDRDWVETKSKGIYNLRPSWREVLNRD